MYSMYKIYCIVCTITYVQFVRYVQPYNMYSMCVRTYVLFRLLADRASFRSPIGSGQEFRNKFDHWLNEKSARLQIDLVVSNMYRTNQYQYTCLLGGTDTFEKQRIDSPPKKAPAASLCSCKSGLGPPIHIQMPSKVIRIYHNTI